MNTNGKITILLLSVTICNLFKSQELLSVTCLKVENLVIRELPYHLKYLSFGSLMPVSNPSTDFVGVSLPRGSSSFFSSFVANSIFFSKNFISSFLFN